MAGLIEKKMAGEEPVQDGNEAGPFKGQSPDAPAAGKAVRDNIQVPPELQDAYERMVLAGRKVMFSQETHESSMSQLMKEQGPIADRLGRSIAGLVALLFSESGNALPPMVLIPVGTNLLSDAADFLNESGTEKVTNADLAEAMGTMIETLFEAFGITPEKIQEMAGGGFQAAPQQQAQPAPQGV